MNETPNQCAAANGGADVEVQSTRFVAASLNFDR
jgi:hypothetical protein